MTKPYWDEQGLDHEQVIAFVKKMFDLYAADKMPPERVMQYYLEELQP